VRDRVKLIWLIEHTARNVRGVTNCVVFLFTVYRRNCCSCKTRVAEANGLLVSVRRHRVREHARLRAVTSQCVYGVHASRPRAGVTGRAQGVRVRCLETGLDGVQEITHEVTVAGNCMLKRMMFNDLMLFGTMSKSRASCELERIMLKQTTGGGELVERQDMGIVTLRELGVSHNNQIDKRGLL
jgi:hypothetical protein